MELRHRISPETNASIYFGSVSSAKMLATFILTEMAQTCKSINTTLWRIYLKLECEWLFWWKWNRVCAWCIFYQSTKISKWFIFIDYLSKEDKTLPEFISYVHKHVVGKNLVARSQDWGPSSARSKQLVLEEVEMQLSIAALVNTLNPSQVSLLAKYMEKIREIYAKRRVPHDPISLTKTPKNI